MIDNEVVLESSTTMPPASPLNSATTVETYFSQLAKMGDMKLSYYECEMLAKELNVNSSVLNTCNGDWRILLFAACPMDPQVEKRLRRRADVYSFKSTYIIWVLQLSTNQLARVFFG